MSWEKTRGVAAAVIEAASTGSTNADMAETASAERLPHLSVLLTRDQRAGRGRLDRQWAAPAGASLAVSVLVRVDAVPVRSRGWVSLIAGSAMASAVRAQLPAHDVGAKWPNDVLVDGRKICGILAEGTADGGIIVGSGINTRMTEAQLPVPTATSFAALAAECDEDRLVAEYLAELDRMLTALAAASGNADDSRVRARVLESCVTLGRAVRVMMPGGDDIVGTATTLNGDGHLVVGTASGLVEVSAGDVVHVRPA